MPRSRRDPELDLLREHLMRVGDGRTDGAALVALIESIRSRGPEAAAPLDRLLVDCVTQIGAWLSEAKSLQEELGAEVDKITAMPWHPGRLLAIAETPRGRRALVLAGNTQALVDFADGLDPDALRIGDHVLLSSERNLVMAPFTVGAPAVGETAVFERTLEDGRLVIRSRDEELVVTCADALDPAQLEGGQRLRWDRAANVALEALAPAEGARFLFRGVEDLGPGVVGGQDRSLARLLSALTAQLVDRERAARYGLDGRRTCLMVGPPGCGKTLMARVCAARVQALSGRRCRFAVVRPGEFESPFVGESEANIRACFEALRAAAADGMAILVLDEVEAIGRIRGGRTSQHADRSLAALLAEIDGFAGRGEVALIAATNRKDLIDPALLERLSDVEIAVGRPDRDGAQAIFAIHLRQDFPYHVNGRAPAETRDDLIETAASLLYAANADNDLCKLFFRDGVTRTIAARELVSGRLIEQICKAARENAFRREREEDGNGLEIRDVEVAIADALERLASTLSAHNARSYLDDLPQDVDIVRVERIARRPSRLYRYYEAA